MVGNEVGLRLEAVVVEVATMVLDQRLKRSEASLEGKKVLEDLDLLPTQAQNGSRCSNRLTQSSSQETMKLPLCSLSRLFS